jgi:hypothetical protein
MHVDRSTQLLFANAGNKRRRLRLLELGAHLGSLWLEVHPNEEGRRAVAAAAAATAEFIAATAAASRLAVAGSK